MEFIMQVNKQGRLPKQAISDMQKEFVSFAGKKIRVKIEKYHAKRSLDQNGAWWGIAVKIISDFTGYYPDEVHDFLCKKFIGKKIVKIGNEEIETHIPSKDLTKLDFADLYSKTQIWASTELNLIIPDPDPNWKGNFTYLEDELGIKE